MKTKSQAVILKGERGCPFFLCLTYKEYGVILTDGTTIHIDLQLSCNYDEVTVTLISGQEEDFLTGRIFQLFIYFL